MERGSRRPGRTPMHLFQAHIPAHLADDPHARAAEDFDVFQPHLTAVFQKEHIVFPVFIVTDQNHVAGGVLFLQTAWAIPEKHPPVPGRLRVAANDPHRQVGQRVPGFPRHKEAHPVFPAGIPQEEFHLRRGAPLTADAEGQDTEVENIYAMQFKEQESGFFAGMAAALETKSNKVAVVNGIAYPSNVNYQYGFECGVKYVNETDGKAVEIVELPSYAGTDVTGVNVGGNYIGSFADAATGKVVGNALIDEGVDIMFVAAGDSGNGVFTAAKEAEGVYVIGCDVDQYDDGANGDANVILTSGLKVMSTNVDKALETIVDGSFAGGNVTLGADTDSTGYVSADGRCQLSADTITKVDAAYEKVKAGEIVPAANFNGITPDDFKAE